MTRAMRAAKGRAAPRVLRTAIITAGRVVEERTHTRSFEAFERTRDGWSLRASRVESGRVVACGRVLDVRELGEVTPLEQDARGRVVVGGVTYLFQLTEPAPARIAPRLPTSVLRGAEIDWRLTVFAALSFLLHFGFVGALYSDWNDAPVDDGVFVRGLVDMSARLPSATPVEDPSTPLARPSDKPMDATSRSSQPSRDAPSGPSSGAALAARAEAMEMGLLASLGSEVAVRGALDRSNAPVVDLDRAARSREGASTDPRVTSASPLASSSGSLRDLGVTARDGDHHAMHQEVEILYTPSLTNPDPLPQSCGGAERVIARVRPSLRACYMHGFDESSTMEGKLVALIKVGPNGEVQSVVRQSREGLSDNVEACVLRKLRSVEFDATPGGCSVQVPVSFRRQK